MTAKQWAAAADLYNDPETYISPGHYSKTYGYPKDPLKRNGTTLQKFCLKFEEQVSKWTAEKECGKKRK
jgi:hypothetical protein